MFKFVLLLSLLVGGSWAPVATEDKPDLNSCLESLVDVMSNPPGDVDGYAATCIVVKQDADDSGNDDGEKK